MSRFVLGIGILALLLAAPPAAAGTAPLEDAVAEMVMGRDDAPVTMIEYSSLACPHCAAFHREVLPKLKETYIGPGKVRLVFRDFPLGGLALAAAMVARCGGREKYFGYRAVARLRLLQGPLPKSRKASPPAGRPLEPGEEEELVRHLCTVDDPELRHALEALGRAVIGRRAGKD